MNESWAFDLFSCTCDSITKTGQWYVYKPSNPDRVLIHQPVLGRILPLEKRKELYFQIYRCDKCGMRVERSSIIENARNSRIDNSIVKNYFVAKEKWVQLDESEKLIFLNVLKEYFIKELGIGIDVIYLQYPEIFLKKNMGNTRGYTNGSSKIYLNSNLYIENMVETLAHEVFHLKQFEEVSQCENAFDVDKSKIGNKPTPCNQLIQKNIDPMVHYWNNEIIAYEKATKTPKNKWTVEDYRAFYTYRDQFLERNARQYAEEKIQYIEDAANRLKWFKFLKWCKVNFKRLFGTE